MKRYYWITIPLIILFFGAGLADSRVTAVISIDKPQPPPKTPKYIVLGWNNLGMHCYNPDFSNLAILPPYNTLIAQVIKVDEPPQIVTSGVIVEYSFPDNTYSVD